MTREIRNSQKSSQMLRNSVRWIHAPLPAAKSMTRNRNDQIGSDFPKHLASFSNQQRSQGIGPATAFVRFVPKQSGPKLVFVFAQNDGVIKKKSSHPTAGAIRLACRFVEPSTAATGTKASFRRRQIRRTGTTRQRRTPKFIKTEAEESCRSSAFGFLVAPIAFLSAKQANRRTEQIQKTPEHYFVSRIQRIDGFGRGGIL